MQWVLENFEKKLIFLKSLKRTLDFEIPLNFFEFFFKFAANFPIFTAKNDELKKFQ